MTFTSNPPEHWVGDDWRIIIRTFANMLISGDRDRLETFCEMCQPHVRQPITYWCAGTPLQLGGCRTLVLVGVEGLTLTDQQTLSAWLTVPANGETQILSLSMTSLFAAVEDGRFDRDLFYRLNTIHLRLDNEIPGTQARAPI
jgi:hypothetical protein